MRLIKRWKLIFAFSVLFQAHAHGADTFEDIRIITGLSLGYTNFSFPAKLDHDIGFPSANLLLAATKDRWQLSFNGEFSLQDADISEEEDVGSASRRDLDVTLGYQATQHWAVFTGYKSGETKLDFVSREGIDEGELSSTSESYAQDGPYIGISYTWQFENAGRLSVSVAYASLNAVNEFAANTDDEANDEEAPEFDDLTGRVEGDTKGFGYRITWAMPLSSNLLFQAKFKINDYKQNIDFKGTSYDDIDETLTSLYVGLAYVF